MKFTPVQKAFLALIVANIIWGAASPIFKLSLQNIPPFTLAFWRFFGAAILLLIFLRAKVSLTLTARKDFIDFVGFALSGITVNIIFFFLGLQLTHAINAPVIASAAPIMTLFFALLFLREKFHWKKFLGMVLGSLGILIVIIEPILATGIDGSIVGNIYLVIATLGAVGGTIFGRNLLHKYPNQALIFAFWAFIIGAASFLPLAVWEYLQHPTLYQILDWRGWLGLGFGIILSSAVAYALFVWALSKISATDAAMFTYIDPIAGSVLSVLILKEPITGPFLLGTLFIFGGIWVAEGRLHYHPFHKLKSFTEAPLAIEKTEVKPKPVSRSAVLTKLFRSK